MKVLVASLLLLLCAGCLQAAMVRRETSDADTEAPPALDDFFSRHFQSFSDFVTKDLPQKLQVEEISRKAEYGGGGEGGRGCPSTTPWPPLDHPLTDCLSLPPRTYVARASTQLGPMAQELQSNIFGIFSSLLKLGKSEEQP